MKQRMGFVSNSSTSSFCIFGVYVTPLLESWMGPAPQENGCTHEFDRESMKFCPSCGKPAFVTQRWHSEDYRKKAAAAGFDFVGSEGDYWVGKRVSGKPNFDQLKQVSEKIKEIFGVEAEFISGEYAS